MSSYATNNSSSIDNSSSNQTVSLANFLWSVADLLRGDFKQSQYGRIILPFTLLRRLESVLEESKDAVLAKSIEVKDKPLEIQQKLLAHAAQPFIFYNTSKMDLHHLGERDIASNLTSYIEAFSANAREIFEYFDFFNTIDKLNEANLLYTVTKYFAKADLHPDRISNHTMGQVFEELIRRFAESSNETAGEHFTPRDIVELTTALVFCFDDKALSQPGVVRSIYDPTAGTGGFLSAGMEYVNNINAAAVLSPFGQELNPESYAICKADMLIKGQEVNNIKLGNTLSQDHLRNEKFDYMLSNPPFGVDWKKVQKYINDEHTNKGHEGRFGAGLPRVSDGSLLFLMHLISKMRPLNEDEAEQAQINHYSHQGGSRVGIILNGSPLFTGGAGSGESEIRRSILENDLLEAIIALPTDMFYNTGIATYIWILSNNKPEHRKGKVQLINASKERSKAGGRGRSSGVESDEPIENVFYQAMRKSLGSKRKELTEEAIDCLVKTYGDFVENDFSKIFDYRAFGYRRITVERPLKLAIYPTDAERIAALQADKAWLKLDEALQAVVLESLASFDKERLLSRNGFLKALAVKIKDRSLALSPAPTSPFKLSATQQKLLLKYLAEHDDEAEVCRSKGKPEANPELRDYENVPLTETVESYFAREVAPHVPDAWVDESKRDGKDNEVGIVGYEIPFNRHFYVYEAPRALAEIDADLDSVSSEIMQLLKEVHS